ncbi:hypothetical protein BU24DRAFT_58939 [Aaosphaeria arxii CBS 175.79]|uniref:Uncharacterized protein n=1 Tax=Aaosphaeria arxii CBS 175.79 TaxID=1450172 RepID=A0A6A5XC24_9PLEO|nr:uncharacterized protein BU24DRAFT_58939 [Aaosphaeria arxii CBS 175.79]KAF2010470.1 hypothetical protein BU24DRAFT_58939 [Aaosphaeria arxii CBS 175.79]
MTKGQRQSVSICIVLAWTVYSRQGEVQFDDRVPNVDEVRAICNTTNALDTTACSRTHNFCLYSDGASLKNTLLVPLLYMKRYFCEIVQKTQRLSSHPFAW